MASGQEGQKVHGTYVEQLNQLQDTITQAIHAGAATPEEYRATMVQLLKAAEGIRLKSEGEIRRYEIQIAFYIA
jgi:hypothetical protein